MDSFELIPTEENLIKALNEDLLQRNKGKRSIKECLISL